ncbi:MAG TPA: extracellular solute-binding protein [Chloroflexota bacterium]|jgi:iron(III) transport system substrate-binding protein
MRTPWSLVLSVLVCAALLGCGPSAPATGSAAGAPATQSGSPGGGARAASTADDLYGELAALSPAELDARLLEGARKEGVVRLYSAYPQEITADLKRAFESAYPGVRLEFVQGTQTDIKSRVQAEFRAGRYLADVIWSTNILFDLNREFPMARLRNLQVAEWHPKELVGDYWVAAAVQPMITAYNTSLVHAEDLPHDWDGLLDPKWRGKLTIDVEPWFIVTTLVGLRGEAAARDWVEKLLANDTRVLKGASLVQQMQIAGEIPVVPQQYINIVEPAVAKGAPMDWVVMAPVPVNIPALSISNQAEHPYAAMLFARFYASSKAAGDVLSQQGLISIHPEVEPAYPRLKRFVTDEQLRRDYFVTSPDAIGKYKPAADEIIRDLVFPKLGS